MQVLTIICSLGYPPPSKVLVIGVLQVAHIYLQINLSHFSSISYEWILVLFGQYLNAWCLGVAVDVAVRDVS